MLWRASVNQKPAILLCFNKIAQQNTSLYKTQGRKMNHNIKIKTTS